MVERVLGERVFRWGRLPDLSMRTAKLREYFSSVSSISAAVALEELLVRTRNKEPDAVSLYLALFPLFQESAINNKIQAWRREAFKLGLSEVCYLLASSSDGLKDERDPDKQTELHPELQELTLGEKKSFARRLSDVDVGKFVNETNPQVLEIFFRHPAVKENHVVRMLSRRPQRHGVFEAAILTPKWLASHEVRRAVVFNPYSPLELSVKILPLLRPEEIQEVVDSKLLANPVRVYAARLRDILNAV